MLGVRQESVRSLSVVCQEFDGNQIWRADLDSSPKLDSKLRNGFNSEFVSCISLLGVCQESIRSLSGVCQESVRSLLGIHQESIGSRLESIRSLSGVWWQTNLESWFGKLSKIGELIWIPLQLVSSPTKSSWICKLYESVGSQSGVCWEYVMSLSVVCEKSDGNQIWRADLDSSPKLRTGVTSNKK